MNWFYKVLLVGVLVGSISISIGFYVGNSIDTSYLYKESSIIQK